MNLFFNPSENEFCHLLQSVSNDKKEHHLVVDFDGEVLIDPQIERPDLDPNLFLFQVKLNLPSLNAFTRQSNRIKLLFSKLQEAWNEPFSASC